MILLYNICTGIIGPNNLDRPMGNNKVVKLEKYSKNLIGKGNS